MEPVVVKPSVGNFVKSLRDIGYTFEIAVADILDNSISAGAKIIKIHSQADPSLYFCILDDGIGMTNEELIEAMRLATKNPDDQREKSDLGRFGLGLKTASFSQCKKMTVVSKKNSILSVKQWDLDYISQEDEWLLRTPEESEIECLPLFEELKRQKNGTLVIWQEIDSFTANELPYQIDKLSKHLSLVFHRFLENKSLNNSFKIELNNNVLKPFNPFNEKHLATQELAQEKIKFNESTISIRPYILPHHSKLSQKDYDKYATEEGYTKSQGFYLYRENRLLIHGTWWGLHKLNDAHKLVRIKIDISNDQDRLWGIDVKKSTAKPVSEIKKDLKRIINQVTEKGSRPYTGRGKKIEDKSTINFWGISPLDKGLIFSINKQHPIYVNLLENLSTENFKLFDVYLKGLEAYLPLDAIQSKLQTAPHEIKQESALSLTEIQNLANEIKSSGLDQDYIESLLSTELFQNNKELLLDGEK